MKLFFVITITIVTLSLNSFAESTNSVPNVRTDAGVASAAPSPFRLHQEDLNAHIEYFGQGVYYFTGSTNWFGANLAGFLKRHHALEVTAMVRDNEHFSGGYIVTFREKK